MVLQHLDESAYLRDVVQVELSSLPCLQVVVEFEGVVVEDTSDLHTKAWMQLADAEGKSRPLQFALQRAEGMKNEQVCAMHRAAARPCRVDHDYPDRLVHCCAVQVLS